MHAAAAAAGTEGIELTEGGADAAVFGAGRRSGGSGGGRGCGEEGEAARAAAAGGGCGASWRTRRGYGASQVARRSRAQQQEKQARLEGRRP